MSKGSRLEGASAPIGVSEGALQRVQRLRNRGQSGFQFTAVAGVADARAAFELKACARRKQRAGLREQLFTEGIGRHRTVVKQQRGCARLRADEMHALLFLHPVGQNRQIFADDAPVSRQQRMAVVQSEGGDGLVKHAVAD